MRDLIQALIEFIVDTTRTIFDFFVGIFKGALEKFLEINIYEKLIVITTIPAFFAVVMAVGKFYIFEIYFYLNNPLAVYMIGIVFFMYFSLFIKNLLTFALREIFCLYYLFWVFYKHLGGGIAKTQYELTFGYYLNIIVPVAFIIFSMLSFLIYRDEYI
jgi:small-conductance mechanosensitive channel